LGKTVTGTASSARKQATTFKDYLPELVKDRKSLASLISDNNGRLGEAIKDQKFLREDTSSGDTSMTKGKWLKEITLNAKTLKELRENARYLATIKDAHQSETQRQLKVARNIKTGLTTKPKDVQLGEDLDGVIKSTENGIAEELPEILGLEGT